MCCIWLILHACLTNLIHSYQNKWYSSICRSWTNSSFESELSFSELMVCTNSLNLFILSGMNILVTVWLVHPCLTTCLQRISRRYTPWLSEVGRRAPAVLWQLKLWLCTASSHYGFCDNWKARENWWAPSWQRVVHRWYCVLSWCKVGRWYARSAWRAKCLQYLCSRHWSFLYSNGWLEMSTG